MSESENEEYVSLQGLIQTAVSNWCAANGGGFPIAMVCAVDFIDHDGTGALAVAEFDNQPTHRSMGLVRYLDSWYADDAQQHFLSMCQGHNTDDED